MRKSTKFVLVLSFVLLSLSLSHDSVFAISDLTITISPADVTMSVTPELFSSMSQTITASTSDEHGYTIKMRGPSSTSALVNTEDPTFTIPTFTLPPGSSSLPADSTGYGYGFSLDEGANYLPIPEPETPPIDLFSSSEAGEKTHTLTYGILTPEDQKFGVYTNAVSIYIVANFEPCAAGNICYDGNGDDGRGLMDDQPASSDSDVTLIAPNFSRPGYGFAGWNTAADGGGTNYGPNQVIHTGDLSTDGLQLYARWVESTGTLQGWTGCSELAVGEVTALTDLRDNNTYAVGKYADGQCWMMENLRLDLSDSDLIISGTNTNGPTHSFVNTVEDTHPASTNSFCEAVSSTCIDQILYNTNNTNRDLTPSYNANNNSSSWYSYGHYYNWYTATAGNGTYSMATSGAAAEGDLCPANWRLPAGAAEVGDLSRLDVALGGNGKNQETAAASKRWRNYPINYIYSGEQRGNTAYNRANSVSSATLNTINSERTMNLWVRNAGAAMSANSTGKVRGSTMRCLYNSGYHVNGNIHYDANGGSGTMQDQIDVNFGTATAAANGFTKEHYNFVAWNSSPDGKGVVVTEGSSVAGAADRESLVEGDTLNLYAIWKASYTLVYDGNGDDVAGSMSAATVQELGIGSRLLAAPNYSRDDYGFVGWSLDQDAANKLATDQPVDIYGPNETITVDNNFLSHADPTNFVITLYAVWVPEDNTHTMQTFGASECADLGAGKTLALRDIRDNNVYAVAKLADGNCWMIENMRLDPAAVTFDNTNTNKPTEDFIAAAPSASSSNNLCNANTQTCIDSVGYNANAINRGLNPSPSTNNNSSSWYGYGVMYNWYAVSAGNGTYDFISGSTLGDICPANWRLPTGGGSGEFVALYNAVKSAATATAADAGLVKFPANFYYAGDYNHTSPGGRNSYGRYWSSTPKDSINAHRLGFNSKDVTAGGAYNKWDAFAARCIVKNSP